MVGFGWLVVSLLVASLPATARARMPWLPMGGHPTLARRRGSNGTCVTAYGITAPSDTQVAGRETAAREAALTAHRRAADAGRDAAAARWRALCAAAAAARAAAAAAAAAGGADEAAAATAEAAAAEAEPAALAAELGGAAGGAAGGGTAQTPSKGEDPAGPAEATPARPIAAVDPARSPQKQTPDVSIDTDPAAPAAAPRVVRELLPPSAPAPLTELDARLAGGLPERAGAGLQDDPDPDPAAGGEEVAPPPLPPPTADRRVGGAAERSPAAAGGALLGSGPAPDVGEPGAGEAGAARPGAAQQLAAACSPAKAGQAPGAPAGTGAPHELSGAVASAFANGAPAAAGRPGGGAQRAEQRAPAGAGRQERRGATLHAAPSDVSDSEVRPAKPLPLPYQSGAQRQSSCGLVVG